MDSKLCSPKVMFKLGSNSKKFSSNTSNFILVIIIPNINPNKDIESLYINDNLYVYVFHSKSKSNGQRYSDQNDNRRFIKFLTYITPHDLLPSLRACTRTIISFQTK